MFLKSGTKFVGNSVDFSDTLLLDVSEIIGNEIEVWVILRGAGIVNEWSFAGIVNE